MKLEEKVVTSLIYSLWVRSSDTNPDLQLASEVEGSAGD